MIWVKTLSGCRSGAFDSAGRAAIAGLFEKEQHVEGWRHDTGLGEHGVDLATVMGLMIEHGDQDVIGARLFQAVADDAAITHWCRQPVTGQPVTGLTVAGQAGARQAGARQAVDALDQAAVLGLSLLAQARQVVMEDLVERPNTVVDAFDATEPQPVDDQDMVESVVDRAEERPRSAR